MAFARPNDGSVELLDVGGKVRVRVTAEALVWHPTFHDAERWPWNDLESIHVSITDAALPPALAAAGNLLLAVLNSADEFQMRGRCNVTLLLRGQALNRLLSFDSGLHHRAAVHAMNDALRHLDKLPADPQRAIREFIAALPDM